MYTKWPAFESFIYLLQNYTVTQRLRRPQTVVTELCLLQHVFSFFRLFLVTVRLVANQTFESLDCPQNILALNFCITRLFLSIYSIYSG